MFARRARRSFEVCTRTMESPKAATLNPKPKAPAGGRAKATRNPGPAAANKRGAADDAGLEVGGGGKKPKAAARYESDSEDE